MVPWEFVCAHTSSLENGVHQKEENEHFYLFYYLIARNGCESGRKEAEQHVQACLSCQFMCVQTLHE